MCRPVLQILTLAISDHVISHTRFQTWPLDRNYVIITQIRAQTKNSSNPVPIPIVLFLSQSFGIGTINTFIHSRGSLENHTRFQNKMGKVYDYPFQTKKAQKTLPDGAAHTYIAYTREQNPRLQFLSPRSVLLTLGANSMNLIPFDRVTDNFPDILQFYIPGPITRVAYGLSVNIPSNYNNITIILQKL